jgi:hypothetical protein
LHTKYLDRQGLLALWREAFLAQKVLQNRTRGYRHHPQLLRWKAQSDPEAAIAAYLRGVHAEASARGYAFDENKIAARKASPRIRCQRGQLTYELNHLKAKLQRRDRERFLAHERLKSPQAHPLIQNRAGRSRTLGKALTVAHSDNHFPCAH